MLSRCLSRTANICLRTLNSSNKPLYSPLLHPSPSPPNFSFKSSLFFSTNRNNNGGDDPSISNSNSWRISPDNDEEGNSIFGDDGGDLTGFTNNDGSFGEKPERNSVNRSDVSVDSWGKDDSKPINIFGDVDKEVEVKKSDGDGIDDGWETAEGYKPWSFDEEEKSEVFDIGDDIKKLSLSSDEKEIEYDQKKLEEEEKELTAILKGPNRAFGDLIAASGITDAMLDSLIALKDLEHVEGLPPLHIIEDIRLAKTEMRSVNSELERKKQEEIANSRVRRVDDKNRAYGTGRRKCSVARVFIQPGEGAFIINDKQFDAYFPLLDHRATLLSPFSETKTLGLWDVKCTVKGGGTTGQVGAIRLGLSRALQNFEPGLRPNLRSVGFLTRDPRMVERKKPGKAKARKSFQWVKR